MKKATAVLLALLLCATMLPAASANTPIPAITSVTSPILYGYAANVKVVAQNAPAGAYVQFNGSVSAPVVNGSAMIRLTAADLSGYEAGGFAPVELRDAAGGVLDSSSVQIKPYNANIWEIGFAFEDGVLKVLFNAPVYYRDTNAGQITVRDIGVFPCYTSEDSCVLLVPGFPELKPGSYTITVPKVKLECFPSYSFTYSAGYVVPEPDTSVKLIAAEEQGGLKALTPVTTSDGNGNFTALYDVTSLTGQFETFPYFTIQNVEDVGKLELTVGNHEWAGYTGIKLAEVAGMPGVYQRSTGNAVHWQRERYYPDYVIWTVYYDGAVVGTFRVTVDITQAG